MKQIMRRVGFLLLMSLFLSAFAVYAQEDSENNDENITISGSRIVFEALTAIISDSADLPDFEITGTSTGFQAFCSGETDAVGAIRPLSVEEEEICLINGISYAEYLVGYNVLVFVAHPDLTFAECLTSQQVNTLFAPSSQGNITDWAQIGLETTQSIPLNVVLPRENTIPYALLDEQVDGFGLREDVQFAGTNAEIVEIVANTEGAIGVVPLSAVSADDENVKIVQLRNVDLGRCITPSVETTASGEYTLQTSLLLYTNIDAVSSDVAFLQAVVSDENADALVSAGFTPPTAESYALNQAILAGEESDGRQFSRDLVAFEIPADTFGSFFVGGAASLATYIRGAADVFNTEFPAVQAEFAIDGQIAGVRRFCSGELDMIVLNRELTEEELTACRNNTIETLTLDLGAQAVVLVANATPDDEADDEFSLDDYPECLSREQVQAIWAHQAEVAQNWSDIDPSFPDTSLILVAPNLGQVDYTDILLSTGTGPALPERVQVAERRNDPAYRAAAVGNVRGGLTYMSWVDYQNIEENRPENIRLIAIGNDCILPSNATIRDGSYPYALQGNLIISLNALSRTEVQSFVWYLFQDSNFYLFEAGGLTGIPFGELPTLRENIQDAFADALAVAVQPPVTIAPPARGFGPQLPFDLFAPQTPPVADQ